MKHWKPQKRFNFTSKIKLTWRKAVLLLCSCYLLWSSVRISSSTWIASPALCYIYNLLRWNRTVEGLQLSCLRGQQDERKRRWVGYLDRRQVSSMAQWKKSDWNRANRTLDREEPSAGGCIPREGIAKAWKQPLWKIVSTDGLVQKYRHQCLCGWHSTSLWTLIFLEELKKISVQDFLTVVFYLSVLNKGTNQTWSMTQNIRMDKSVQRKVSTLRPPPLFRSIGPSGLSASLPPHRRLRSIFCRSRAVQPANTHSFEASDSHTFTDIQGDNHARAVMCPLDQRELISEDIQPSSADSDVLRRTLFGSTVSANPQAQIRLHNRPLFSHLCPSARASEKTRGREGRLVTSLQTSDDPPVKDKQQRKRRKRSYKVDCAGKYVVPTVTETEEDARLCEWLRSLDVGESDEKNTTTTNNRQRLFASRCRGADTVVSHSRDRRPHFLPPICQSNLCLHVPLMIPENSPPPSPYTYPDAPIHSLTVPSQLLSSRRKWEMKERCLCFCRMF